MDPVLELGQRLDAGVPEVDPAVVGQMDRRPAELGLAAQAPRRWSLLDLRIVRRPAER